MAEEPAAPEAKKSDTFQFPDGSKYGWPSHFPFLPPPRSFDHIALDFIGSQHFFAEGEYEEVAGQEEGSVKRVRQVTLLGHPPPLPLPLRHSLLCSKSAATLTLLTLFHETQGFGLFTHVSGNVCGAL